MSALRFRVLQCVDNVGGGITRREIADTLGEPAAAKLGVALRWAVDDGHLSRATDADGQYVYRLTYDGAVCLRNLAPA